VDEGEPVGAAQDGQAGGAVHHISYAIALNARPRSMETSRVSPNERLTAD
jgi:hypothetical protein